MRVLFIHPSPLMYSEIYLRLEPLGLERVAAAALQACHDVRILDLQIFDATTSSASFFSSRLR
jgi:hopanoid C-3 methylase